MSNPLFIQWAFPSPERGVKNIELEEFLKQGSISEFLEELTRSSITGPTLQFEFIFDFNCSTMLSSSLSNDSDFPSFPSLDPRLLPFTYDWAVETIPQKLNAPGDKTRGVRRLKWWSPIRELENNGDLLKQLLKVKSWFDWPMLKLCYSRLMLILGKGLKSSWH